MSLLSPPRRFGSAGIASADNAKQTLSGAIPDTVRPYAYAFGLSFCTDFRWGSQVRDVETALRLILERLITSNTRFHSSVCIMHAHACAHRACDRRTRLLMERELGSLKATLDEERRLARTAQQRLEDATEALDAREIVLDQRQGAC